MVHEITDTMDVEEVKNFFPECHVHPISRVQVGLAWKDDEA